MSTGLPPYVALNGRVVATRRAHVSVFDRGLLYSDGVFETLRTYAGRPFALAAHLRRLQTSAAFLGIAVPRRPWQRDIVTLIERNRLATADAAVRITVTRGLAAPGLVPPRRVRPTLIVTTLKVDPSVAVAQRNGVGVVRLPFARHGFLSEHKVLDYLPAVLGKTLAAGRHAFEGLYVDEAGRISEGTTSNVFICCGRRLVTPPVRGILPGVTRRLVMDLAVAVGFKVDERPLTSAALDGAEEIFLTSAVGEVVPVVTVDGRPVGPGTVGERTRQLQVRYRQLVDQSLSQR